MQTRFSDPCLSLGQRKSAVSAKVKVVSNFTHSMKAFVVRHFSIQTNLFCVFTASKQGII